MKGGKHIAVIGTGRVGRATIASLLGESWLEKITFIDTEPGLAEGIKLDFQHALGTFREKVEVASGRKPEKARGADLVLITASQPRSPDMESRDELTGPNAPVIADLGKKLGKLNPEAFYIVVTNPVDAMATLFADRSEAKRVISTGTNLESSRFRAELARRLKVEPGEVEAFVAGEHGPKAVFLWSTVRIEGKPLDEYLAQKDLTLQKQKVERAVREQPLKIIEGAEATRLGPAASFREILRGLAGGQKRILSLGTPYSLQSGPDVMLSLPRAVNGEIGKPRKQNITEKEKNKLQDAAEKVQQTYLEAKRNL